MWLVRRYFQPEIDIDLSPSEDSVFIYEKNIYCIDSE